MTCAEMCRTSASHFGEDDTVKFEGVGVGDDRVIYMIDVMEASVGLCQPLHRLSLRLTDCEH